MDVKDVLKQLEKKGDPANLEGMARYGITPEKSYGASLPDIRTVAKGIKKDHALALELWDTGIMEAQFVAVLIADPKKVDRGLMERWASDFSYWSICDHACMNLFFKVPGAWETALEWSTRNEPYVKRAAFAIMAKMATKAAKRTDEKLEEFIPVIVAAAKDDRNEVKKGVSWALRQIGKRSWYLNEKVVKAAEELEKDPASKWAAKDVLRELRSDKVKERLDKRK